MPGTNYIDSKSSSASLRARNRTKADRAFEKAKAIRETEATSLRNRSWMSDPDARDMAYRAVSLAAPGDKSTSTRHLPFMATVLQVWAQLTMSTASLLQPEARHVHAGSGTAPKDLQFASDPSANHGASNMTAAPVALNARLHHVIDKRTVASVPNRHSKRVARHVALPKFPKVPTHASITKPHATASNVLRAPLKTFLKACTADMPNATEKARKAFASVTAKALDYYGARDTDNLSEASVRSLVGIGIEYVAFGSPSASWTTFAKGAMVNAARNKRSIVQTREAVVHAFAKALGVNTDVARQAARNCPQYEHAMLSRDDLDVDLRFGSLQWFDLQSGARHARQQGFDASRLSAQELRSIGHLAESSMRSDTLPPSALAEADKVPSIMHSESPSTPQPAEAVGAAPKPLGDSWSIWEFAGTDGAVSIYAAYEGAAERDALETLAATLDRRWNATSDLLSRIDTLENAIAARPTPRRALASKLLREHMLRPPADGSRKMSRFIELYMSYPDGKTATFWLPNLDEVYRKQCNGYADDIAKALTNTMNVRAELPGSADWFSALHGTLPADIVLIVPRIKYQWKKIQKGPEWLKELWRHDQGSQPDRVVVGIEHGAQKRYWLIHLSALLDDVRTGGAQPVNAPSASDFHTLVVDNMEAIFAPESVRLIRDHMKYGDSGALETIEQHVTPKHANRTLISRLGDWAAERIANAQCDHGYEVTFRQKMDPYLKSILEGMVPLKSFIEAVIGGNSAHIGVTFATDLVPTLLPFIKPAATASRSVAGIASALRAAKPMHTFVAQLKTGVSVGKAVQNTARTPAAIRAAIATGNAAQSVATDTAVAVLNALDPGVESVVGLAHLGLSALRRAAQQFPSLARALGTSSLPASSRQASLSSSTFDSIDRIRVGGTTLDVLRDTQRNDGTHHYFLLTPATNEAYGRRFMIADGKIVDSPRPHDRIELTQIGAADRYQAHVPAGVQIEVTPGLRHKGDDAAMVRIDESWYAVQSDRHGKHLARVSDKDTVVVTTYNNAKPEYSASVKDRDGKATLELSRLVSPPASASAEDTLVNALAPYAVEPTQAMQDAAPDAYGVVQTDDRRYLKIRDRFYLITLHREGPRVCLDTHDASFVRVRFNADRKGWELGDARGLRGGGTDQNPITAAQLRKLLMEDFENAAAVRHMLSALNRHDRVMDLSRFPCRQFPRFVRHAPWVRSMVLRLKPQVTYLITPELTNRIVNLRLHGCDGSTLRFALAEDQPYAGTGLASVEIADSPALKHIEAEHFQLDSFWISGATHLETLQLKHCKLTQVHVDGVSTTLRKVDLSDNALTADRIEIQAWRPGQPVSELPLFSSLTTVFLERNRLGRLPDFASHCPAIDELDISSNRISSLPDLHPGTRSTLTWLDAGKNQIVHLRGIGQFKALEVLGANHNKLTEIPHEIGQCTRLTDLYLSWNQVAKLPESMKALTYLSRLHITHNHLIRIPGWVGELRALEHLLASNNRIERLAPMTGHALQVLDLARNPLVVVPETLKSRLTWAFPNLRTLSLSKTQIHDISGLDARASLEKLFLRGNPISTLPKELPGALKLIDLRDCEFEEVPLSLLEQPRKLTARFALAQAPDRTGPSAISPAELERQLAFEASALQYTAARDKLWDDPKTQHLGAKLEFKTEPGATDHEPQSNLVARGAFVNGDE